LNGHAGTNTIAFQGRLNSTQTLAVGSYRLMVVATDSLGRAATPQSASFTIVSR
jgi:hypothetical protein